MSWEIVDSEYWDYKEIHLPPALIIQSQPRLHKGYKRTLYRSDGNYREYMPISSHLYLPTRIYMNPKLYGKTWKDFVIGCKKTNLNYFVSLQLDTEFMRTLEKKALKLHNKLLWLFGFLENEIPEKKDLLG